MFMKMKPITFFVSVFVVVTVLLPALLVLPYSSKSSFLLETKPKEIKRAAIPSLASTLAVPVYRTAEKKVEKVALEEYVKGVVASEMPADFKLEALKAQALTARTYIARLLDSAQGGNLPGGAAVTDSILHQVYKNDDELKKLWGDEYPEKMKKITKAVAETKGKILTYDGKPIFASFFSTSNGYTENSEDYWGTKYPYLKSVKSPWDQNTPKFVQKQEISLLDVERRLGVVIQKDGEVGTVTKKTAGNRIARMTIDGKSFKGKEIREKLGLRSADFTLTKKKQEVIAVTKGFGHGVGMSQYGANGMAKAGKNYKQIVKYYYKGVAISEYKPDPGRSTAKQ
ncbi:stage II sporulation protein D [Fictibacillus sp. WQ 8-8]|uniref:stage II sporulation protein D n=1 Tax=unclassified Fictibacillus TaxID=2644029 RepID=UPI00210A6E25|nr:MULTISPECIES: stage II sporulation protein D [unclassified Fictibacillus]MCQ6264870.1 stage II sporulation protein D [Fictibacillus sp. WQ 8-8]MED2970844.1 stage II sporulation protein D [Fictibacillus sp. B-59209]